MCISSFDMVFQMYVFEICEVDIQSHTNLTFVSPFSRRRPETLFRLLPHRLSRVRRLRYPRLRLHANERFSP